MTNQPETKTRIIPMTCRAPVRIVEDEWPIVAQGPAKVFEGPYDFQANWTFTVMIAVRKHADGRCLVYGTAKYASNYQGSNAIDARAGELVSVDERVAAGILSVAETLCEIVTEQGQEFTADINRAARECISRLPAETL